MSAFTYSFQTRTASSMDSYGSEQLLVDTMYEDDDMGELSGESIKPYMSWLLAAGN